MPLNEPTRVPFGQMCEMPVGDRVVYRCSLRRGHLDHGEPHYAIENPASIRMWQKWNAEQAQKEGIVVEPDYPGTYTEPEPREVTDIKLHEVVMAVPTKQREGDQQLPDGDASQPDIQSLVIADWEGRRQVGIERYGQGLKAFNGRDTLRDAYEEAMDLSVYLRSLLVMREASYERLIEVAAKEVDDMVGGLFQGETRANFCTDLATRIVRRMTDAAVVRAS